MAPLLTLLLGSLAARVVGALGVDYVDSWPRAIAVGLAAMFVLTGVAHFVRPLRNDMIAIESGTADVLRDGKLIRSIGPGDVVGEIGVLERELRTASVVASAPARGHDEQRHPEARDDRSGDRPEGRARHRRPTDVPEPLEGEEGPEDHHHHTQGDPESTPHLSSRLRILPVAVMGSSSTSSTMRGYL